MNMQQTADDANMRELDSVDREITQMLRIPGRLTQGMVIALNGLEQRRVEILKKLMPSGTEIATYQWKGWE
jgi:hypothetical protein